MIPDAVVPRTATATPATGQGRLIGALVGTNAAGYTSIAVPMNLLLVTHLTAIAGAGATSAFSLVTGIGGLVGLLANPLGGRLSDRTAARFGRRRTGILTGGLGAAIVLVVLGWTTEVWQVALGWALVTTRVMFQLAASAALAADQVAPERHGAAWGVVAFVAPAGPVAGFAAVSALPAVAWLQWAVVGALSAVGVLVTVLLVRDPQHRAPAGERLNPAVILRSYWVSPRKHPAFGWAWAVRFPGLRVHPAVRGRGRRGSGGDLPADADRDRLRRRDGLADRLALGPDPAAEAVRARRRGRARRRAATDFALCLQMLPDPESAGKDFAVLNIASTLPVAVVPFVAPALLAAGGFFAMFACLAVLSVAGAVCVLRVPDIGQEGQPRFAAITVKRG
ncbi:MULTISPECIES: MFS transporter [unclassified Amycolatopsis]|uniref:MFS transporter n=1 Tax=unclassified Amycolatopsis TaxID=2618356 RepID=UPI002875A1FA|nr:MULTISPECIES: MFS transporter [unclassified Amycolatopsis]MDS0136066.1 MFS transporter [Amycolatopsis sp. 505]MDS0145345.1 MFS transporter [Amycolatopsis sp. CM201R]